MWPLAALSRWLPYRGKIYSKMHWEDLRVAAMDRWPPYGGGREGRFDCIYILYIYMYVSVCLFTCVCVCVFILSEKLSSTVINRKKHPNPEYNSNYKHHPKSNPNLKSNVGAWVNISFHVCLCVCVNKGRACFINTKPLMIY